MYIKNRLSTGSRRYSLKNPHGSAVANLSTSSSKSHWNPFLRTDKASPTVGLFVGKKSTPFGRCCVSPPCRDRSYCAPWKISIATSSLVKRNQPILLPGQFFLRLSLGHWAITLYRTFNYVFFFPLCAYDYNQRVRLEFEQSVEFLLIFVEGLILVFIFSSTFFSSLKRCFLNNPVSP